MIPYERSLVTKMEGRPFALLGVNCDKEQETIQQVGHRQEINWRNWWNGGVSGPLTSKYDIKAFPTTIVLDANGVVRYRGGPGPQLDQTVERLVREAEGKKK